MPTIPKRFSFIKYKKQRYEVEDIKIPSPEFPLYDKPEVFYYENTKFLLDFDIIQLIDEVEFELGKCFDNVERLFYKFKENNKKVQPYVGWLIMLGDEMPTLHCWAVYKNKYLIDLSDSLDKCIIQMKDVEFKNEDERRKYLIDFVQYQSTLKNSDRCTLGVSSFRHYYIGSKCTVEQAKNFYINLMQKYPFHRSLVAGTNASGRSPLQQILESKK